MYLFDIMLRAEVWYGAFQVVDGVPSFRILQADHGTCSYTARRQRRDC